MRVSDIIKSKGGEVVTLPPTATVKELVDLLTAYRIGAVVVEDELGLAGIVSEKDVVRFVSESGDPGSPISAIMTTGVTICRPEDEIRHLANVMTVKRVRHLPVLENGTMIGIVSIGDVVKARLDDLQAERDHLERYVHGRIPEETAVNRRPL